MAVSYDLFAYIQEQLQNIPQYDQLVEECERNLLSAHKRVMDDLEVNNVSFDVIRLTLTLCHHFDSQQSMKCHVDAKFQDAVISAVQTSTSALDSSLNLLLHSMQTQHEEILKEIKNLREECVGNNANAIEQLRQEVARLEAEVDALILQNGQLTLALTQAQATALSISVM